MRFIRVSAFMASLVLVSPVDGSVSTARRQVAQAPTHTCPMHPDVRSTGPGTCSRCGMPLVPIDPLATRDYLLEVRTEPHPIVARMPFRLRLTVRDPDTKTSVGRFAVVHEKLFHLFVISQDLAHYDHVHPELQPDGTFTLDVTVPSEGFYRLFADFLPDGGTPQVIAKPLVTRGYQGDLTSAQARLTPDRELTRTLGGMSVALAFPRGALVAGRDEKLTYLLRDARTGAPVEDIEPYLGAWGHTLIMSEDMQQFVHAHPVEELPESGVTAGGGPELTFKALLPQPGNYRVWTQLKRAGQVHTAVFTIAVASPSL